MCVGMSICVCVSLLLFCLCVYVCMLLYCVCICMCVVALCAYVCLCVCLCFHAVLFVCVYVCMLLYCVCICMCVVALCAYVCLCVFLCFHAVLFVCVYVCMLLYCVCICMCVVALCGYVCVSVSVCVVALREKDNTCPPYVSTSTQGLCRLNTSKAGVPLLTGCSRLLTFAHTMRILAALRRGPPPTLPPSSASLAHIDESLTVSTHSFPSLFECSS